MIKIGILTFHWADNFGAVLQAYALQQTLKQMGADAEIINFCPSNLCDDYRLFPNPIRLAKLKGLKTTAAIYASKLRRFSQIKGRISSFSDFRKRYLRLSGHAFDGVEKLKKFVPSLIFVLWAATRSGIPIFCRCAIIPIFSRLIWA